MGSEFLSEEDQSRTLRELRIRVLQAKLSGRGILLQTHTHTCKYIHMYAFTRPHAHKTQLFSANDVFPCFKLHEMLLSFSADLLGQAEKDVTRMLKTLAHNGVGVVPATCSLHNNIIISETSPYLELREIGLPVEGRFKWTLVTSSRSYQVDEESIVADSKENFLSSGNSDLHLLSRTLLAGFLSQ